MGLQGTVQELRIYPKESTRGAKPHTCRESSFLGNEHTWKRHTCGSGLAMAFPQQPKWGFGDGDVGYSVCCNGIRAVPAWITLVIIQPQREQAK